MSRFGRMVVRRSTDRWSNSLTSGDPPVRQVVDRLFDESPDAPLAYLVADKDVDLNKLRDES